MTIGHDGRGRDHGGGGAAGGARRRLGAVAAGAVLAFAALASAGERYAASDDPSVLDLEGPWRAMIVPPTVELCTGNVTFRRTEETRDPATSAPGLATWTPLDRYETGAGTARATDAGGTTLTHDGGGDLDAYGNDGYFMYRFAARGASCFLRIVLEAEDGASETWRIRYRGTESATVTNGPEVRATELTFRDEYFVTWNRDVVDTDGVEGDFTEDKTIEQDFAVRLRLVDGSEVHEGARFALTSPSSAKTSRVLGPRVDVKVDDKGVGVGLGLGLSWGEEKTYGTFSTLPRAEREHSVAGSASVTRALPCPDTTVADVQTWFDGDFSVRDHEGFTGSEGARQELTLAVVHQLSAVRATGCVDCPKPPPPTTPPTVPPTVPPTAPPGPKPLPPTAPPVTTPDDPPVGGTPSPTPLPTTPVPTTPLPTTPVPAQPLPATPAPTGPGIPLGPLLPPQGGAPFVPLGEPAPADGPLVPRAGDGDAPGGCPLPESSPWPGPVPAGPSGPCDPMDATGAAYDDLAAPTVADGPPAGRY